jgi:carbon monoxide dehydrogenase subunit G
MEFRQSFVVKAPVDAVWAFLTDPRRAASALPGAALTEQTDDKNFAGTLTVKVGPVSTQYRGKARFERLDAAARTAEMVGSGQDVKGRGGAEMKMTSRLVERTPGETEVSVVSEVSVTGILAQLGRGMIQDVSDQLFERFTAAVRAELEQTRPSAESGGPAAAGSVPAAADRPMAPANEPIQAVSFGARVAVRTLSRWTRSPAFWVGMAAVAALVLWLLLR